MHKLDCNCHNGNVFSMDDGFAKEQYDNSYNDQRIMKALLTAVAESYQDTINAEEKAL